MRFAEYVVLDALIGNVDRHHENWGVLRRKVGSDWRGFLAPSYDHASSLGRELTDANRIRYLAEKPAGWYSERGRGAIYDSDQSAKPLSPLELVRWCVAHYPHIFRPALQKLERVDLAGITRILNKVPATCMSQPSRHFAVVLLSYNLSVLRKLLH